MADIKIAGRIKAGAADNIAGYASEILFDDEASDKTVKEKLEGKQDTLTFDNVPTKGSNNPVKSGGVYQAIQDIDVSSQISGKADKSEMSVVAGTGANADKTTITLKSGTSATVLTQHQDVSEFLKEGEVFGEGDDSTASFNSYSDTVWNKQQTLSESQKQQVRENIGVSIADNEDIQSVNGTLKFADRAYTATTSSVQGNMGYKILRKGSTFASQVTTANTIYEIRYNFVLSANFNMPSNCVLKFNGGSVSGAYSLTGANTKIEAGLVKIFGTDTTISGTWNINEAYPEWFGAKGDGATDDSQAIQSCIDYASVNGCVAFLPGKDYICNTALNVKAVTLMGCGRDATGTILRFAGTNGIIITGRSTVIENVLIVQSTDGSGVGIDFDDGNFGIIPDVFINNVSVIHFEYGLRATKSISWSNKFDNIRLQFNKNAVYIDTFAGNLNGTHFCNEFNNLLILNVQGGYSLYLRGAMCIFNNANISCVSNYCIWVSSSFVQFNSCSFENDSPVTDNRAMIFVGKYVDFVNCRFVHNYTTDGNNYFIYSQTGTDLSIRFINCNEVSYTGSKLTSIVYPGFGVSSTYGSVYESGNSFSIYDTVYNNYKPYIQRAGQPISVFSNTVDTSKMKENTLYDYLDETTQKRHLVYLKNGQLYDFKTNMQVGVISERTPITPLSGTDGGCYYEVFDKHYVHVHVAITDLTNDTTTIVLALPNSIRVDYAMPIFYSNTNGNPSQYTNLYYGVIANGQVVKYKAATMYADIYYFIP